MFSVTYYVYFTTLHPGPVMVLGDFDLPAAFLTARDPSTPLYPWWSHPTPCHLLERLLLGWNHHLVISLGPQPLVFHFLSLGGTHTWTSGGPPGHGSLGFPLVSISFLPSLPFLTAKPHGVHHFSGALSVSPTPSVPTVFLARLPGKPASVQQANCPFSTHIWAAGSCRRRSHSCSAWYHHQFMTFTLTGLLTAREVLFNFSSYFISLFPKFAPGLSPTPVAVCLQCCLIILYSLCSLSVAPHCPENKIPTPSFDLWGSLWPGSYLAPRFLLSPPYHTLFANWFELCSVSGKHRLPRSCSPGEEIVKGTALPVWNAQFLDGHLYQLYYGRREEEVGTLIPWKLVIYI